MVTIVVNGNQIVLEKAITLTELLTEQKVVTPEYVTVQLNDQFVERGDFDKITVQDGDVVDFLYFMGGGR